MSKLINSDNSCSVEVVGDDVVFRSTKELFPETKHGGPGLELKWPINDLNDLRDWLKNCRPSPDYNLRYFCRGCGQERGGCICSEKKI